MSKELKVICTGSGFFSQFHYEAWSRIKKVNLVGICSLDQSSADQVANAYAIKTVTGDFEDLLDKCEADLIDIITPPDTHFNFIQSAARRGINVICQKPFGQDLEQAKEIVEIADSAAIKLIVHENFRFMPWYRKIKEILGSGFAGRVLNAQFNLRPGDGQGEYAYLSRQPYFQKLDKFLIHETAIHFVDVFRFLFGEVDSVYARLRRCNPVIAGEDSGLVLFNMKNGVQAIFDGNRLVDHATDNTRRTMGTMLIEGTAGTIRLDGSGRICLRQYGELEEKETEYPWQDINFGGDCVYQFTRHAVDHLLYGKEIENIAGDYLQNIRIENAIYQSNDLGRVIDLPIDH